MGLWCRLQGALGFAGQIKATIDSGPLLILLLMEASGSTFLRVFLPVKGLALPLALAALFGDGFFMLLYLVFIYLLGSILVTSHKVRSWS